MRQTQQTADGARILPGPGTQPQLSDRSIGAMLIDAGKITPEDAERVLRYAKEKSLRFGDSALALKLVREEDIQQALARQFDYPYLTPGESSVSQEVVAAWSPFSPQVEALRALRSQLMLRWFVGQDGPRTLAVASPGRKDGRTYLAANLAVVFSQMGERTLLIDADFRNGRQHELFAVKNSAGLSTILAERTGQESIQRVPSFVDLSVLPAGPTPPNPLELLGRPSFGAYIEDVSKVYDIVIIDTPAATIASDYQLISQKALGVLVVGRRHRTSVASCRDLRDEVVATGAAVVGSVLNLS